jgi:hypothetical protein
MKKPNLIRLKASVSFLLVAFIVPTAFWSPISFPLVYSKADAPGFVGKGLSPGGISFPSHLAVDTHRIVIADEEHNQIAIYSEALDFRNQFGSFGQNEMEFDGIGRMVFGEKSFFVVDTGNQRIQQIDFQGRLVRQFSTKLQDHDSRDPFSIAIVDDSLLISYHQSTDFSLLSISDGSIQEVDLPFEESFYEASLFSTEKEVFLWEKEQAHFFSMDHQLKPLESFKLPDGDPSNEKSYYHCAANNNRIVIAERFGKQVYVMNRENKEMEQNWTCDALDDIADMAFSDDTITLSCKSNARVVQYSLQGNLTKSIFTRDFSPDYWLRPAKLIHTGATIWALDIGAGIVREMDVKGTILSTIKWDSWVLKTDRIVSFAIFQDWICLLSSQMGKIYMIHTQEDTRKVLGPFLGKDLQLLYPEDIASDHEYLYVADSGHGRIVRFDPLEDKATVLISHDAGKAMHPNALDVNVSRIVVADAIQGNFRWYDKQGKQLGKAGKRGNETGSFAGRFHPSLVSSEKIILADTDQHRIQLFDIPSESFQEYGSFSSIYQDPSALEVKAEERYQLRPGFFFYPHCAIATQEGIWVAEPFHSRIQILPLDIWEESSIEIFPQHLEIIVQEETELYEESFWVWSEGLSLATGTVTTSNPGIVVEPSSFSSVPQLFKVQVSKEDFNPGTVYKQSIVVTTSQNEQHTIDFTIFYDEEPTYRLVTPAIYKVSTSGSVRIPFAVETSSNFEENISLSVQGAPPNVIPKIEPSLVPSGGVKQGWITLNLNPNRPWEHGHYVVTLLARSARTGLAKQKLIQLFLHHSESSAPRRVLSELFSGVWCTKCIYYHYVFHQLDKEIGNAEANFIQYYVFTTASHPTPRLAWERSNQRIQFYQRDKGLPALYFDGIDSFKGVPYENPEEATYEICRSRIEKRTKDPSLLSISAFSTHDQKRRQGILRIHLKALDDLQAIQNPQLYIALVENNIDYRAPSGKKEHHLIFRDFITYEPDNLEQLSISLKDDPIGFTGIKGQEVFLDVPYSYEDFFVSDHLHFVIFVQDQSLKKVLQSYRVPLGSIHRSDYYLQTDEEILKKRLAGDTANHRFYIFNPTLQPMDLQYRYENEWMDPIEETISLAPLGQETISLDVKIPDHYLVGSILPYSFTVHEPFSKKSRTISSHYEIIEELDPGFTLQIDLPKDTKMLSGETLQFQIQVAPDPYFLTPVSLSLDGETDLLEQVQFTTNHENPPYEATCKLQIKKDAFKEQARFTIKAQGEDFLRETSFLLTIDKNPAYFPPELIVFSPQDDFITNQENLIIVGKTDAQHTVQLNGKTQSIGEDGTFEFQYQLTEGWNEIVLTAENSHGLQTQVIIKVVLDTIPPEIEWLNLPETLTEKEYVLKGSTDPSNRLYLFDDLIPTNEEGYFEIPLELSRGDNYFEVTILDLAENQTTYPLEIRLVVLIWLQIGKSYITVNKERKEIPAAPYIQSGRTMVPLRALSEAFGFKVEWIAATREIVLTLDRTEIRLFIGKKELYLNNEIRSIDVPPEIVNSSTFVPLRVISEIMGATIDWNAEDQSILIEF